MTQTDLLNLTHAAGDFLPGAREMDRKLRQDEFHPSRISQRSAELLTPVNEGIAPASPRADRGEIFAFFRLANLVGSA